MPRTLTAGGRLFAPANDWTQAVVHPIPRPYGSGAVPWAVDTIAALPGGVKHDPEGQAADETVALIRWKDSRFADRLLTLGSYLHQYDFSFYDYDKQKEVKRTANDKADGHPGFGYVVSHAQNGNSPLGKRNRANLVETLVYSGGHHAIHRIHLDYDRDQEGGGEGISIPVVIQWFVATGRDHPVWSVTWDTAHARNPKHVSFDDYPMDVRGPYGSLNFDGAANSTLGDAIGGVAWGDCRLRFMTIGSPLNLNSAWTYKSSNSVNFVHAWTASTNSEMGIVQTRPSDPELGYPDRVEGRERDTTSADGKPDCTDWGDNRSYVMPCVYGWAYQLMNYDWDPASGKSPDDSTSTKLLGWGSPYGWLGASSFSYFDSGTKRADGRKERCYATFIVLGLKNRYDSASGQWDGPGDVSATISAVEALAAATVTNVATGTLVDKAPKGPGASEMKIIVSGYDDTYAAYRLAAANNAVAFTFTPAVGKPVEQPIFVIQNYTTSALPHIRIGGRPFTVNDGAGSNAFVSINPAANELWITLNVRLSQSTSVSIQQSWW